MGKWMEMTLSGSAGELASVSLDSSLTRQNGGTGFGNGANFAVGDLLVGDSSNNLRQLAISAENGTVLKVDTGNATTKLQWEGDTSGGVSEIEIANASTDQLGITTGTTTAEIDVKTAAITGAGTGALATGLQIETYVNGSTFGPSNNAPFTNNAGTITGVNVATSELQNSLTFLGTGTTARTLTLGGSITDLTKESLSASDRRVTVGNQNYNLGVTTVTSLTGMTGLNLTAGSKTLFDSFGASTLSIGGAGNVKIAGNLTVEGTASFENSENIRVKDKVFTVGDGSDNNTGGFFVQQSEPVTGTLVGEFFGYKYGAGSTGRFGFVKGQTIANIEDGTSVPDGTPSKPWAAVVEVNNEGVVPSSAPSYGGSSAGQGNIFIDSSGNGKAYVYI